MSDGLLPHTVITRKAVTREARYSGTLGPRQLPRLSHVLRGNAGDSVQAEIAFIRDDEERQVVLVDLSAEVELECQRCLEPVRQGIKSHSELAIVRTDQEAQQLPARYEPLIVAEEADLWEIVQEELSLALPVVAYHPEGECSTAQLAPATKGEGAFDELDDGAEEAERPNPFEVLSSLLVDGQDSGQDGSKNNGS